MRGRPSEFPPAIAVARGKFRETTVRCENAAYPNLPEDHVHLALDFRLFTCEASGCS